MVTVVAMKPICALLGSRASVLGKFDEYSWYGNCNYPMHSTSHKSTNTVKFTANPVLDQPKRFGYRHRFLVLDVLHEANARF